MADSWTELILREPKRPLDLDHMTSEHHRIAFFTPYLIVQVLDLAARV